MFSNQMLLSKEIFITWINIGIIYRKKLHQIMTEILVNVLIYFIMTGEPYIIFSIGISYVLLKLVQKNTRIPLG
jgi:hypothetical protein